MQKYVLVLGPVAVVSLGTTLIYSALNWFLIQRDNLIPLANDVASLWLPLVLSFGLALIPLRRLGLLASGPWASIAAFFLMIAAVVAPVVLAQGYVSRAAGKITHVASAEAIASAPRSKFYTTDTLCFDREHVAAWPDVHLSGAEDDHDLIVTLFVAVPVCGASHAPSRTWIGLTFDTRIDSRLPDAEKDRQYHAFLRDVDRDFAKLDPSRYRYLERIGFGSERRNFDTALKKSEFNPKQAAIFTPHQENFEGRGRDWALAATASFAGCMLVLAALLIFVPFKEPGTAESGDDPETGGSQAGGGLIVPTRDNYGLPLLLDANLAVYVCMVLAGLGPGMFQSEDLIAWGGNYGPALHGFGILRLITSQFVHGGFMHIANNMYGLLVVSAYLFPVAMNARLIACYLFTGLCASIASAVVHPEIVSVGASGAIFGLCGILTMLLVLRDPRLSAARGAILTNMAIYIAINLAIGAATPGIDNAAHVGGLLTGAVLGIVLFLWDKRHGNAATEN